MVRLLPLNNFYPVTLSIILSSKEKESDELLYTVRSLVMVARTSCQRKGLINKRQSYPSFIEISKFFLIS